MVRVLFLALSSFLVPCELHSMSQEYRISGYSINEDLRDFDERLKDKFLTKYSRYDTKKYADVIDALMSSEHAENLKRVSFHLSSYSKIEKIFEENSVDSGFFINNLYSSTYWIKRKNSYHKIPDLVSFVATKEVYELLRKEGVFEDLKKLTIK